MTDRDRILGLLEEIHNLVEENGNVERTLRFDAAEGKVALDFAKTETKSEFRGKFPKQN